jgi:hypothetical protein
MWTFCQRELNAGIRGFHRWMVSPATVQTSFPTYPMMLAPYRSLHLTQPRNVGPFARRKSAIQPLHLPGWISAQTAEIMKIIGTWQAVAAPSSAINAFKQTGFQSIWDREHRALVMSVRLPTTRKLQRQRTKRSGNRFAQASYRR